MTFEEAVSGTPHLEAAYRRGLGALRRRDREKLGVARGAKVSGSIDLDSSLEETHPQSNRWDYGIAILPAKQRQQIIWIEVHPASSNHVSEVLRKLSWLRGWLRSDAPLLNEMTEAERSSPRSVRGRFVWVASGGVSLAPSTPQRRAVAAQGLEFAGGFFKIE
jgi:hypothetical protein